MFAYSSIEHMGLMTFAFGMGGPIANFAGLLHMTVHSLVKSAIFFAVGHATQNAGTQVMDEIRGLLKVSPTVGWGLMLGTLAILGMPPFGVFASEFLILTTAMREHAWATPFLLLALGVAFAAVFGRVQPMVFGDTAAKPFTHQPALAPVFIHLGLGLMLGLYIPPISRPGTRRPRGSSADMRIPGIDLDARPAPGAAPRRSRAWTPRSGPKPLAWCARARGASSRCGAPTTATATRASRCSRPTRCATGS